MKILIPVDGSPYSAAALEFIAARPFAEGEQPQIDVLNVQLPVPPRAGRAVGAEFVRALHEAESSKVLKPALSLLRAAHLDPTCHYRVGNPAVEIVEWAEVHGSDLIVIGSHGHTALKALIFGSVTQRVLASTTVPLLVLRTAKPPRRASLRVGIALDGSDYGVAAARYVLTHLRLFGPRPIVTLIHVAEPTAQEATDSGQSEAGRAKRSPAAAAAIAAVLGPVRTQFQQAGVAVHEHGLVGTPAEQIAGVARNRRLDLLAMGSHGRGAFKAALLGSVASRVAATCSTPLLLLRLPERKVDRDDRSVRPPTDSRPTAPRPAGA
jgi:nucleotide-binding universal stress UspA family protein